MKKVYTFETTDKLAVIERVRREALEDAMPGAVGDFPKCSNSKTLPNSGNVMLLITNNTGKSVSVSVYGDRGEGTYVVGKRGTQLGPFPLSRWGDEIVISYPDEIEVHLS